MKPAAIAKTVVIGAALLAVAYWTLERPGQGSAVNARKSPQPASAAFEKAPIASRHRLRVKSATGVVSLRQSIERQVDAMIAASQKMDGNNSEPQNEYAHLTPAQKTEYRQRCLSADGIKDLVAEHLDYHRQHGLETWERENEILQAMQAKCERIRPFATALASEAAGTSIDPDTGLGEFYLDLLAQNEENGPQVAAALAMQHLMDPLPQRRDDARRFLVENGVIFDFLSQFMPADENIEGIELDRSQIRAEPARQLLEPLFAVADCEAGLRDCGPGSFWALQQCRDYPRSCGMSPYAALHYNTPPSIMAMYDRILQALRAQYRQSSSQ
jgi:hypothetical protein